MNGEPFSLDYARDRNRLSLARNAVLLADHEQVLRESRDQVKALNRRTFGADYMPNEEDTNIHIGDIVNQPPTTTILPAAPAPIKRGGLSPLAAGLIGAGILAVGGPLAALAWNAIANKTAPPAAVAPHFTDTDTQYQIQLVP